MEIPKKSFKTPSKIDTTRVGSVLQGKIQFPLQYVVQTGKKSPPQSKLSLFI